MVKVGLVSPFSPEKDGIALYSANLYVGASKKNIIRIGRIKGGCEYVVDFTSFSLKSKIERIIAKEKLDVVHFEYVASLFGKYSLNLAFLHALSLSVPTVVTLHEVHYTGSGMRHRLLSMLEKKIVSKSSLIIVHSPRQKSFLEKKYGASNIRCIYHGLWSKQASSTVKSKEILFMGMISQAKGVPDLIAAMDYLEGYSLTIAGRMVDDATETSVANALKGSASKITTHFGWVEEKEKEALFKRAAVCVLPYTWAPYQSGVLHNALSFQVPVVVTDVGALPEIVADFECGEVVAARDIKGLAEGIRKVASHRDSYLKGISRYQKKADWKVVASEHFDVYGSLK
ncbi:MAG: glycosyltransferase family 4 protein [Nanoarchaeota archaeon]|nr:glycosyltransferase family 4 protein [Nanoarchaeota archaeon]